MKTWIFILAICFSSAASAQLSYRSNDPFVFCTYGQISPTKCWWPISARAGTIFEDPTCAPPNYPDGRPWTPDDYASRAEWYAICTGVGQGEWRGVGTGEQVPTFH